MAYKKYEAAVSYGSKTVTLKADHIGWEYPQTDGEGSGATDENYMIREILPERDKITLYFAGKMPETEVRKILEVRSLDECSVNFYDLRAGARLTKRMYPVCDEIIAETSDENGVLYVNPFNLRFVQTRPN